MNRQSSEAVFHGHPDKLADTIADAIVDSYIDADPMARVACEVTVKSNTVILAGEVSAKVSCDLDPVVRKVIKDAGYKNATWGIDPSTCTIASYLSEQSPEIAKSADIGAGDQAIVYGFATDATKSYLPLPHHIAKKVADTFSMRPLPFQRPDGKTLCILKDGKVDLLVLSLQHDDTIDPKTLKKDAKALLNSTIGEYLTQDTRLLINPSGSFIIGGPIADSGVTGRKIIADTYGAPGPHGGGAFSGKDPTKIDRSGALAARFIAKNIVATTKATQATVQIAYAIGTPDPIYLQIETDIQTDFVPLAREKFPLAPAAIIEAFDLRRPIYQDLAIHGHFGRNLPWEQIIL